MPFAPVFRSYRIGGLDRLWLSLCKAVVVTAHSGERQRAPILLPDPLLQLTTNLQFMASSYPTGGPSHYYGNNPQDETYHDPSQYYNPQAPHETYDPSGYREPDVYLDEPGYTLPQGQSAEPLGLNTKEEPDYVAEEFTPTPRQPRCVHRRTTQYNDLGLLVFI